MKFLPFFSSARTAFALSAGLLLCLEGDVSAQTLPEALDTAEFVWTSAGPVEAVTEPGTTFDGADAVRLNADPADAPERNSWIETRISQPSIITFRHRSRDLAGTADFSVLFNGVEDRDFTASFWKQERLVVLPGVLRITNRALPEGNPLYIDMVTVTPAAGVSLNEALEAPGVVFSSRDPEYAPGGIADAFISPDGVDSVVLGEAGELTTALSGPALVSFRGTAKVELAASGTAPPEIEVAGRRQFAVGAGVTAVRWRRGGGTGVVDQVSISSPVSFAEALDSTGLVYEYVSFPAAADSVSAFGSRDAPPGAKGGSAVAFGTVGASGTGHGALLIRGFTGPGILRCSVLGFVGMSLQDRLLIGAGERMVSPNWVRVEIPVTEGAMDAKFMGSGWLDDVSWTPGVPDAASLMGQPGADVTFSHPESVTGTAGSTGIGDGTGLRLQYWSVNDIFWSPDPPLLRIGCQGPAMVSFASVGFPFPGAYTVDGGPPIAAADTLNPDRAPEFAVIFPDAGSHSVEIGNPAVFHQLKVQPLTEVPCPKLWMLRI